MIGGMVGCLPSFVLYDDVPTLINILLDAIAILFVLEIDNIVYDVVLHEKLKRAIEKQPTQQLREGTRRKVRQTRCPLAPCSASTSPYCPFASPPSDVSGSYVVLFCISVMLVSVRRCKRISYWRTRTNRALHGARTARLPAPLPLPVRSRRVWHHASRLPATTPRTPPPLVGPGGHGS